VRRITPNARTLGDLFRRRAKASASSPAVYEKRNGRWEPTTWSELYDLARRAARGLIELGVKRGDRVAILGPTKMPWAILDMASQLIGAVSYGIYPKQTVDQIRYLLSHSEAKVIYVDGKDELSSVLAAAKELPNLTAIIPWEVKLFTSNKDIDPRVTSPDVLTGKALGEAEVETMLAAIDPADTAILIYTSGTTGPPKGAMISHTNILSLLAAQKVMVEFRENDLSLNFLPMAHAAERILAFFGRIDTGIAAAYAQSMSTVLDDVADVQPTLFGAVPRIFEKAYAKIQGELAKKPPAVQKLFGWATSVGIRCARLEIEGRRVPRRLRLQRRIADRLVFRKIRAAFGGRVRFFVTGAAPIAMEILELFWGIGLPIYELYGMTEATVATHGNRPGAVKLGTVGRVVEPMEAKIAEDGEILMRGPWVFQGYLKSEDATREALEGGWLHTGDIGTIDSEGFLRITDRKKHLIITAGGKNLAPANIENAIKNQDPLVSQVYAHGDKRSYVIALVAPSPLETLAWGEERGLLDGATVKALTREVMADPASRSPALNEAMGKVVVHPAFGARIREAVKKGNLMLAHVEQVRRVVVLERDFSQEAGELTPTMKVKRKAVEQAYAKLIDSVYEGGGLEVLST
jgi:long-chain acyl-CoA synthetase